MRRREALGFFLGGMAAWPLAAWAQQPAMPVIGYLASQSPDVFATRVQAFVQGLAEIGYIEGRDVMIIYCWAEGHYDRLPALAADLVQRPVSVLVAPGGSPAALAAKAATSTIPIVFEVGIDPVAAGLVNNLNQPEGNITGVTSLNVEVGSKRLQLLHELVPSATVVGTLVNPLGRSAAMESKQVQAAAHTLGLHVREIHASREEEFEKAFATLVREQVGTLVITADPFFAGQSEALAALARRHSLPAVHQSRRFAVAGGLMSYGGNFTESHRLAGSYVGRILKGEKPGDLPVQQVTRLELTINLKAAKALGITVPVALLARADEVIE
jgi:ABC-type uncharacterized transport system substrate-binding protein